MDIMKKISNLFHTKDGEIQHAYQSYDRASGMLDARDKNPAFNRTKELEEQLKETETLTIELLENYEGTKSWSGVFREMHMNLARLWMRTERYEEALKECEKVEEYNSVDGKVLKEALDEIMSGEKLESAQLDEVGVA